jgi:calnexin
MPFFPFLLFARSANSNDIPLVPQGPFFHFQSFNNADWSENWKISTIENCTGQWAVEETSPPQAIPHEKMIFMKSPLSYYGLSTKFSSPLDLTGQTLVLQYEVRYQESMYCGGSYIKLFGRDNYAPETLCNETQYAVMFGPDRCGGSVKVHCIVRYRDSRTGKYEERHLQDPPVPKTDALTHLYTLIVRADKSVEILIDGESVRHADLLKDFQPLDPKPRFLDDPTDRKPEDWVDIEEIDDPDARRPDDWDETEPEFIQDPKRLLPPEGWLVDEPKFVVDPDATKPEDWEDDIHGDWEPPVIPNPKCENARGCGPFDPPLIKNPEYKGKWKAPKIPNPEYKGPWKPRQIPNPDFHEDPEPPKIEPLIGAGFELWMVSQDVGYGNVYIGTDEAAVHRWNRAHFIPKRANQIAEQQRLKTPVRPRDRSETADFVTSLKEFIATAKAAWTNLYEENAPLTVAGSVTAILVPLTLCWLFCGRRAPKAKGGAASHSERTPTRDAIPSPRRTTPSGADRRSPRVNG